MSTPCEYAKFGCKAKLYNEDHIISHERDQTSIHLRLVLAALTKEADSKNDLQARVETLEKTARLQAEKIDLLSKSLKQAESSPASPALPAFQNPDKLVRVSSAPLDNKAEEARPGRPPLPQSTSIKNLLGKSSDSEVQSRPKASDVEEKVPSSRTRADTTPTPVIKLDKPPATPPPAAPPQPFPPIQDDLPEGFERGIVWEYDPSNDEWARGEIALKLEKKSFAEGALRWAFKMEMLGNSSIPVDSPADPSILGSKILKNSVPKEIGRGDQYVAKTSKTPVAGERYFDDVKMQVQCRELGHKFNQQGTPKRVEFLMAWVLQVQRKNETILYGLEPYMEGEFKKLNSNFGIVLTDRNTPQAFSHFTWEHSNHSLLVVDIQGVEDFYTDPQIHTKDGKGHGLGNMGMRGIERFLKSHKCNPICMQLNLPLLNVDATSLKRRNLRGTMKAPSVETDINASAPKLPLIEGVKQMNTGEFQCVQTLSGAEDRVTALICHTQPKHRMFASTGEGTVKVWDLKTMTITDTIKAHRKSVDCIATTDKHLITGSVDCAIKVWSLDNFALVERMPDHGGDINALVVQDEILASASFDKTIKIWSTKTWKCLHTLEGHNKSVKCLFLAGTVLISGSNDGTIKVWNLAKYTCTFSIDAHDGWVKALAVKGMTLYSGAFDHSIKEWDLKNFMTTQCVSEHTDAITCLLATPHFLVSASDDKTIKIWGYDEDKSYMTLKGHRSGIQALATDGKHLYSGSDDYTIKVWKWVSR